MSPAVLLGPRVAEAGTATPWNIRRETPAGGEVGPAFRPEARVLGQPPSLGEEAFPASDVVPDTAGPSVAGGLFAAGDEVWQPAATTTASVAGTDHAKPRMRCRGRGTVVMSPVFS